MALFCTLDFERPEAVINVKSNRFLFCQINGMMSVDWKHCSFTLFFSCSRLRHINVRNVLSREACFPDHRKKFTFHVWITKPTKISLTCFIYLLEKSSLILQFEGPEITFVANLMSESSPNDVSSKITQINPSCVIQLLPFNIHFTECYFCTSKFG